MANRMDRVLYHVLHLLCSGVAGIIRIFSCVAQVVPAPAVSAEQKSGQHVLGLESVAPELLSALSTQYLCGIELFLRYYRLMRVIHNDTSEVQAPDIGFILQDVSHA